MWAASTRIRPITAIANVTLIIMTTLLTNEHPNLQKLAKSAIFFLQKSFFSTTLAISSYVSCPFVSLCAVNTLSRRYAQGPNTNP